MQPLTDPVRLAALRAADLLDTAPEPEFDRLTRIAKKLLDVPVALVSLVETDRQFFKSQVGLPPPYDVARQTPLSHSFCQHVVTGGKALIVTDAGQHPLVRDNLAIRDLSVAAYLGVPLTAPGGEVLGSFCVVDTKPRAWTEDDIQNLNEFATLVTSELALRAEIKRRREAERQQDLLIAELHHRVKNTLAVVQSIIALSVRSSSSLAHFRESISARIISLANTHTLLINQQWISTSLLELLTTELAAQDQDRRIVLTGPDAQLPSQAAVSIGMCIHELATNAVKHGALSRPAGRVDLSWVVDDTDAGTALHLRWVERGGPPVARPTRKGFGTVLLERLIGQQATGRVDLDFQPNGLVAAITMDVPSIPAI